MIETEIMPETALQRPPQSALKDFTETFNREGPLVSVLISNYNHGTFLQQAVNSILRQSYPRFEIILTDDGSSDGSASLIAKLAEADRRIRPTLFSSNRGAMAATAHNMSLAKGQLVYGGAADDFVVDEHFFKRAIEALLAHRHAAGCFGVSGLVSAETGTVHGGMGHAPREGLIYGESALRAFLRGEIFVAGNSSIWRRDALDQIGGFAYDLGPQVDFWINHALPIVHGAVFVNVPLACQRTYAAQTNFGSKGTLWEAAARFKAVEERVRDLGLCYEGWESDWNRWRAHWMMNSIEKTVSGRR